MALHPQCKQFLDILASAGGPPLEQLPVPEARQVAMALMEFGGPIEPVAGIENRTVPGPAGPIPVRVYRPVEGDARPGFIYFHGGGFVICNLDTHDRECRSLANASGCTVISVDYRLAPEHKFPAAVDDAYAATDYIAQHAAEFRIDPERIAVGGDSAGGTLATVVTMLARDRGGPRLKFQLLVYPLVDVEDHSPSMQEYEKDHFLTREGMDWFLGHYLRPEDRKHPHVSPMNATNFRDLPPAMIVTAECDPLRDQGEAYARKLQAAGVAVELKRYEGMIHPFLNLPGILDTAKVAIGDVGAALRKALGSAAQATTSL